MPDGLPFAYDCIAARDGDRVGIVLLTAGHLPFCYMTNDLLIRLEADGTATALAGGSPVLTFARMANDDRFEATAGFERTQDGPQVRVDVGSILKGLVDKQVRSTMVPQRHEITLKTPRAAAVLRWEPASGSGPIRLRALEVHSKNGNVASARIVKSGRPPQLAINVTAQQVERAGITTRPAGTPYGQRQGRRVTLSGRPAPAAPGLSGSGVVATPGAFSPGLKAIFVAVGVLLVLFAILHLIGGGHGGPWPLTAVAPPWLFNLSSGWASLAITRERSIGLPFRE